MKDVKDFVYVGDIGRLVTAAYRMRRKDKGRVLKEFLAMPEVLRYFSRSEHAESVGYVAGHSDFGSGTLYRTDVDYGSAASHLCFFTDQDGLRARVVAAFPEAVAMEVIGS